jgi:hypothetical protein
MSLKNVLIAFVSLILGAGIGILAWTRISVAHAENPAARETLSALRGLDAVTKAGINYAEYARRVLDATVAYDRFERSQDVGQDLPHQKAASEIRTAMRCHQLGASVWNSVVVNNASEQHSVYTTVFEDPVLSRCPGFATLSGPQQKDAWLRGKEFALPALWACAGLHLSEAENLLK